MTRNLVIAIINLAIAAVIGINAMMALVGGCDFGGERCSGDSGVLTWALAVIMPLIVLAGAVFVVRNWRSSSPEESRHIAIPMPLRPAARAEVDDSDAEADDAMSARLARTTSAAHVAEAQIAEGNVAEADDAEETSDEIVSDEDAVDRPAHSKTGYVDGSDSFELPIHRTTYQLQTGVPAAYSNAPDDEDGDALSGDERAIDWLVDSDDPGFAPLLREDSGFPWVVAGIDHVCAGVARIGHHLIGTDFPAEAAAWRQVVGGLGRSELLARDDARAFATWVNGILDVSGEAGLDLIEDALHELGVEAATDAVLSARLPADMADFHDHSATSSALRLSK